MTEIMSFIGERVPSETDDMPSVGLAQYLSSFTPLTQETSGCGYILVSLIEIIKG